MQVHKPGMNEQIVSKHFCTMQYTELYKLFCPSFRGRLFSAPHNSKLYAYRVSIAPFLVTVSDVQDNSLNANLFSCYFCIIVVQQLTRFQLTLTY